MTKPQDLTLKVRQNLMTNSALVQNIINLFESFHSGENALQTPVTKSIMINSWQQFQVNQHTQGLPTAKFSTLTPDYEDSSDSSSAEEQYDVTFFRKVDSLIVLPNQTFIFFKSKKRIIDDLPCDATPLIRHAIKIIDPLKTFATLCLENSLTFEEMVLTVKHLLYWGLGKIIYPVMPNSVYVLTPAGIKAIQKGEILANLFRKIPQKSVETVHLFSNIQSLQQVAVKAQRPL